MRVSYKSYFFLLNIIMYSSIQSNSYSSLDAYYSMNYNAIIEHLTAELIKSCNSDEESSLKKNILNSIFLQFKPSNQTLEKYLKISDLKTLNFITLNKNKPSWLDIFNKEIKTSYGSVRLAQLLIHPVPYELLHQRQKALHYFYNLKNPTTENLTLELQEFEKTISNYLQMCNDQERQNKDGLVSLSKAEKINQALYYKNVNFDPLNPSYKLNKNDGYNDSLFWLEMGQAGNLAWSGVKASLAPIALFSTAATIGALSNALLSPYDKKNNLYMQNAKAAEIEGAQRLGKKVLGDNKIANTVMDASGTIATTLNKYKFFGDTVGAIAATGAAAYAGTQGWFSDIKNNFGLLKYIQTQLIELKKLIEQLEKINALIISHPKLKSLLPSVIHIHNLLEENSFTNSESMNALLSLLKTNTFTGNASFFSFKGRILLAYKYFQECYKEFIPVLKAIGEIDAYHSCAKIMHQNDNNQSFSFVKLSKDTTPYFKAQNLWNPLSNHISESITAFSNKLNNYQNKNEWSALLEAISLANTLSIAPASQSILTPFNAIYTINTLEAFNNYMPPKEGNGSDLIGYNIPPSIQTSLEKFINPNIMIFISKLNI